MSVYVINRKLILDSTLHITYMQSIHSYTVELPIFFKGKWPSDLKFLFDAKNKNKIKYINALIHYYINTTFHNALM